MADTQYQPGDGIHEILRKILDRLNEGLQTEGGEESGGDVGSRTYAKVLQITPTLNTTQYTPLDVFGNGAHLFEDAFLTPGEGRDYATIKIKNVFVIDKEGESPELELIFLNQEPQGTYMNNQPSDFSDDFERIVGRVTILASDYVQVDSVGTTMASLSDFEAVIPSESATQLSLWIVPVVLSSPAYTDTDSVRILIGVEQH